VTIQREKAAIHMFVSILTCVALILATAGISTTGVLAQSTGVVATSVKTFTQINPPPCDFSDIFYTENGIVVGTGAGINAPVAGRFGTFRQTGPPASGSQVNWVADSNCSLNDPTRRNFRILATTGGYPDDGSGSPTEFISILAFLTRQTDDFTGTANQRTIQMVDIVSNFEAYAALKQVLPNGQFAGTPCGTMGDPSITPCFPVSSVATPNLRQDWRFATNRNAIDGTDNNNVQGTTIVNNSPFGYFCDDLLGMWIITYFWFLPTIHDNTTQCPSMIQALGNKEGLNLDNTPIVRTADELNFLEGKQVGSNPIPGFSGQNPPNPACMAEGQEDAGGADSPAAVWLVCPALLDPRNGAIAKDAFLDVVRRSNGNALDTGLLNNFSCLQNTGKFCSEAAPEN